MDRHFRLIAYDVASDRNRLRLQKLVQRWATRVQFSVFEGWLTDEEVAVLLVKAGPLLEPPGDSLRVYRLCGGCCGHVDTLGAGAAPARAEEVVV